MNRKIALLTLAALFVFIFNDPASAQRRRKKDTKKPPVVSIYDVDTLKHAIPRNRQIFHDRIDKEQRRADASDVEVDGIIYYSEDSTLTGTLTKAMIKDVDHMQVMIENMPANGRDAFNDNQRKIRYLTAVWELR